MSVAVSGTEILFSLIDHERIVGVTSFDTDESMSNVAELARKSTTSSTSIPRV